MSSAVTYVEPDLSSPLQIMLASPSTPSTQMDSTDSDCFDVNFTAEAIGSSATAIRSVLKKLQKQDRPTTMFVKFTNVPPQIADQEFAKTYQQMFNPDNRTLIVTIPSGPHEIVASNISIFVHHTALAANIPSSAFLSKGSKRVKGLCCSKEPDGSFYTLPTPPTGANPWPTIVVEVGYSESKKKLRADAAWWIANSEGQVNIVITICIHKSMAEITFEIIVPVHPIPILRNSRPRYQSRVRQSIVVSRPPGGHNQPVSTTPNDPLRISCQELLRRPAIPPEIDPDIPVQSLETIAFYVWNDQEV